MKAKPVKKKPIREASKKKSNPVSKKTTAKKDLSVDDFLTKQKHPLHSEVDTVRKIIKSVDKGIQERVKWNAPSYHFNGQDFVTFNLWEKERIHLVFHHPNIVKIDSPILEGSYDTRRMTYMSDSRDIKAKSATLKKVIKTLLATMKS